LFLTPPQSSPSKGRRLRDIPLSNFKGEEVKRYSSFKLQRGGGSSLIFISIF